MTQVAWTLLRPDGTVIGRLPPGKGPRYYVSDRLGSVRAVLDQSGAVTERRSYYPFGLPMPGRYEKGSPPTEADFTGHVKDDSTGLHYAGARYYSGAFARWTTTEPLLQSRNPKKLLKKKPRLFTRTPYNYTFNNPITLRDPDGRCAGACVAALVVAGAALAGGGVSAGIEYLEQRNSGGPIREGDIAIEFTSGAALSGGVALATVASGGSALAGLGAGAGGGALLKPLKDAAKIGDQFDPVSDPLAGAATGVLESVGAKGVSKGVVGLGGQTADLIEAFGKGGGATAIQAQQLLSAIGGEGTFKTAKGLTQALQGTLNSQLQKAGADVRANVVTTETEEGATKYKIRRKENCGGNEDEC